MALVDVDSWFTEYEACERLSHDLIAQMRQRQQRQRLSPDYNRLTAVIHVGIKQFDTELKQLQSRLSASSSNSTISSDQTARRRRQLEALNTKLTEVRNSFAETTHSDRVMLKNEAAKSSIGASQPEPSGSADANSGNDVQTLKRRQIEILEDQNRGLDMLSQTIQRQREIATQLGMEVEDQNGILDNLANTMERVESGVNQETGNIGHVTSKDSTWGYWTVIILLIIAIVIVAVI